MDAHLGVVLSDAERTVRGSSRTHIDSSERTVHMINTTFLRKNGQGDEQIQDISVSSCLLDQVPTDPRSVDFSN
jgi:hypothetical protein